jgi:hypothetical protein
MRNQTPPLAPGKLTDNVTIHIVLNDFGEQLGRAYVETDEAEADEWDYRHQNHCWRVLQPGASGGF